MNLEAVNKGFLKILRKNPKTMQIAHFLETIEFKIFH